MSFEQRKQDVLSRADQSNKGSIDKHIKTLCNKINSMPEYFTTSSCAGRIRLFVEPHTAKKYDSEEVFSSHEMIDEKQHDDLWKKVNEFSDNNSDDTLWLKQEAVIFHVVCKDLDAAQLILNKAKEAGIKRAGIISINREPIVEILGTGHMEALLVKKGKVVADKDYFFLAVEEANKRFLKNKERIEEFEKKLKR